MLKIDFFKKNITLCVSTLVMTDVIFGFIILALGFQDCEPFFSNYLKLDILISIFATLFMMIDNTFVESEYTLLGMQILENLHKEDQEFYNEIFHPEEDIHEDYHKEELPASFDPKLTYS